MFAKEAAGTNTDRTVYGAASASASSFVVHHTQQMPMAAVAGDAKNINKQARKMRTNWVTNEQDNKPFDHKNGHGYVKAHRGFYHDAIFVKRNNFNLLLHETFGGGFSPTAVLKLRRPPRAQSRARQR